MTPVSPLLPKTRFQLCLRPSLGGVGYPLGSDLRFQFVSSSSTKFCWRTKEIRRSGGREEQEERDLRVSRYRRWTAALCVSFALSKTHPDWGCRRQSLHRFIGHLVSL